ncbi:MAG: hypothetical protein KBD06_04960, partial [Candidatus Pacebacteria bacterium]|nr:hypothetical protein [Candidatus Paceibacterota bacterium]
LFGLATGSLTSLTHGKAYQKLDNNAAVNRSNMEKSPVSGDFSCVTMGTTRWITRWISPELRSD